MLKKEYIRILRFGTVGVLNTVVDFLVFSVLSGFLQIHYSAGQIAAYSAGTLNSFLLNKFWTFEKKRFENKETGRQFIKFISINLISLWATVKSLEYLIETIGMNLYIAKILIIIISLTINYLGSRLWVFRDQD